MERRERAATMGKQAKTKVKSQPIAGACVLQAATATMRPIMRMAALATGVGPSLEMLGRLVERRPASCGRNRDGVVLSAVSLLGRHACCCRLAL